MTNHDLKALRDRLKLSRAKFCALLTDPLTRTSIKADTLYRWERQLPEVLTLPPWVDHAVKVLEAKAIKLGYLPKPLPTRGVAHKHGKGYRYWTELDDQGRPIWQDV